MTDRELLEAAAKAAGLDTIFRMYGWCGITGGAFLDRNDPPTVWNPLSEDGDALRLAVMLRLSIMHDTSCVQVSAGEEGAEFCSAFAMEPRGADPLAATRRAIVRAAAAIGSGR